MFNYCPPSKNGTIAKFYCKQDVRLNGLQYVFCCSNNISGPYYCCKDSTKYFSRNLPSSTILVLLQYWPILLILTVVIFLIIINIFGKITLKLKIQNYKI